jgi:hypothetical protein
VTTWTDWSRTGNRYMMFIETGNILTMWKNHLQHMHKTKTTTKKAKTTADERGWRKINPHKWLYGVKGAHLFSPFSYEIILRCDATCGI